MDLQHLSGQQLATLAARGELAVGDLVDAGICPTCFDRAHGHVLYGDPAGKMLYEDDALECFLAGNPRAPGHTIVSSKVHYKDMLAMPDALCARMFVFARHAMCALQEVYGAESVYLCTMCDGPMNHLHLQLIPRYAYEKRGSKNFVKPRMDYCEDAEKLAQLRKMLKSEETKPM